MGQRYQAGEPDYYINEYIKREFTAKSNQKNIALDEEEEFLHDNNKHFLNENHLKN